MEEKKLPPLKEEYKLNEQQKELLKRYIEEMDHRLATKVRIDVYTMNYITYPNRLSNMINFEVTAGNWHHIATLNEVELNADYGQVFHYFLRRLVDDTMADLLKRGAAIY